jgi:predicted nucleotidyltransferase component of viral defense system
MNAFPNKTVMEEVALELGINPAFVEKDWYVVQILKIIGLLDLLGAQAIFAGGTALAKAHGLLKRFSEDIDFRLVDPALSSYFRSQQKKHLSMLKGLIHDAIVTHFPDSGGIVA